MSKTVLLADDSVTFHKIVEYSLLGEGLNVIATKSAEEAMMRARQQAPSLIIADTYMPKGRSGVDLAAALRGDPKLRHVPVILLASKAVPFDEAKAQALGVAGFLAKPFQSQELLDQVRAALNRASAPVQPSQAPPSRPAVSQAPPARPAGPGGHTMPPAPASMPPQAGVSRPPPARSMPPPARPGTLVPPPPPGAGPRSIPPPPRPGTGAASRPQGATIPPPPRPGFAPSGHSAVPPPRPSPTMPPSARPLPAASGAPGPVVQGRAPVPGASRPPAPRPAPGLSPANHEALLREALSKATREMIEKVVWEVVPDLAEAMIREELARLIKERQGE